MAQIKHVLKDRIAATEKLIETTRDQLEEAQIPELLVDLQISSLETRLNDLKRELAEIEEVEGREQISLKMHPPGLPSGKVSVRTFTLIVGGLQSVADSVANTLYNQPSLRGNIPSEILEHNSLIIAAQKAGSYEVILEAHHNQQRSLDEPEQTQTISEIFDLFESSDHPERLFDTVTNLGPRTVKHYLEWVRSIEDTGTRIDLEWTSPYRGKIYTVFSPEKASRVHSVLSSIEEKSVEDLVYSGILEGANQRTKSFEITTIPEGETITGRVVHEIIDDLRSITIGSRIRAVLVRTSSINNTTLREKVTWTLKEIHLEQ